MKYDNAVQYHLLVCLCTYKTQEPLGFICLHLSSNSFLVFQILYPLLTVSSDIYCTCRLPFTVELPTLVATVIQ